MENTREPLQNKKVASSSQNVNYIQNHGNINSQIYNYIIVKQPQEGEHI